MENNQLPFHLQLHYERILRGWSQADVAEKVGSDVKSVGRWESGSGLPRPYYRRKLYEIFGKNAETMGLLEQSSHTTLPPVSTRAALSANGAESVAPEDADEAPPYMHTQMDWGEAPRPTTVYGRVDECTQLQGWI